jgi:tetratricopeptide (TPR) repeat protein
MYMPVMSEVDQGRTFLRRTMAVAPTPPSKRSDNPSYTISKAIKLHDESTRFEQTGDSREAEARCRVALSIFEQQEGPASADVANILHALGKILHKQRKYTEAEACAHRATVIMEPLLSQFEGPGGMLILISSLALLGAVLREQGRYAEAEAPLVRAIQLGRSLPNPTDALMIALNEYVVLCKFVGRFDKAEIVCRRALELALKRYGSNSPAVATILHNG